MPKQALPDEEDFPASLKKHERRYEQQEDNNPPYSESILSFIQNEEKLAANGSEFAATAVMHIDFKNNTQ